MWLKYNEDSLSYFFHITLRRYFSYFNVFFTFLSFSYQFSIMYVCFFTTFNNSLLKSMEYLFSYAIKTNRPIDNGFILLASLKCLIKIKKKEYWLFLFYFSSFTNRCCIVATSFKRMMKFLHFRRSSVLLFIACIGSPYIFRIWSF